MGMSQESHPSQSSRFRLIFGAALVAIGCAGLLLLTSPGLPMVWDEGDAILRAEAVARWAHRWLSPHNEPGHTSPLSPQAIAQDWPFTTQREGHPAFYAILIAAGRWLSAGRLAPLESARLGPMILFGLACGAMFYRLGRDYSLAAGAGAAAALVLLPRMFAHAHFASFDGPLSSCWVLAWAAFAPMRHGPAQAVLWGIALGMTLSCKATGWIAPLPFLVWAPFSGDRRVAATLAIGLLVGLAVFFALNPPLWHHPIQGWLTFFQLNLSRAARPGLNISTQFLGRMYNLDYPLPWYNTLVWTAVTVPLGTLLLAAIGLTAILRRWGRDKAGLLLVANWLVLLVVRALPGLPPHDGVRLFLPSFAMLAALAGLGCQQVLAWTARRRLAAAGLVLLYAGSTSSLLWYAPQWLSYYNLLIGGLPGATALGMERTYYWDALDRPVLDWLHQNTPEGAKIRFAAASPENLALMRQWKTLCREYRVDAPGEFVWYVLQHRPSGWQAADRWLVEHGQPAYRKTIRSGGWGPWRLDVPLVDIYPYPQYLQACRATAEGNSVPPRPRPGATTGPGAQTQSPHQAR